MIVQLRNLDYETDGPPTELGFSLKPPKAVRKVLKKVAPVLKVVGAAAAIVPGVSIASKLVKTAGGAIAKVVNVKKVTGAVQASRKVANLARQVNTVKTGTPAAPITTAVDAAMAVQRAIEMRAAVMPQEPMPSAPSAPAPAPAVVPMPSPPTVTPKDDFQSYGATAATAPAMPAMPAMPAAPPASVSPKDDFQAYGASATAQPAEEAAAGEQGGLPSWAVPALLGLLVIGGAVASSGKKGARK